MKNPVFLLATALALLLGISSVRAQPLSFTSRTYAVGNGPYICMPIADVNGDGKPDLVTGNTSTNNLTVLTNDGHGGFAYYQTVTVGNRPGTPTAADIYGNGLVYLLSEN